MSKPKPHRSNSKHTNTDEINNTFPPIRSDAIGIASRSVSRGPTPTASVETSGVNLPSIRPPSARVVDTITRVQIKDREKKSSTGSEVVGLNRAEILKSEDGQAPKPESVAEPEEPDIDAFNDNAQTPEDEYCLLSSTSHIDIEDPERQYWMVHAAPNKNPTNTAKEALKRMQAASSSKKLDISDIGLFSIPDKVKIDLSAVSTICLVVLISDQSKSRSLEWKT